MRGMVRRIMPGVYTTAPVRYATSGAWDMLPAGKRARGVNIWAPPMTYHDGTPMVNYLADMWRNWDWTGWLRLNLNLAKQIGCNYFRFPGTVYGRDPSSGYAQHISDDQYFSQWDQLLKWCRTNGMYIEPLLEHDSDSSIGSAYLNYSPINSWRVPEMQHLMRLFAAYLDVIVGVDIINEAPGWASNTNDTSYNNPGGNKANADIIYNALKPIVPTLPLTISSFFKSAPNQTNPWTNNVDGNRLAAQGVFDFIDAHIYYDAAPGDFDICMSVGNKPMLLSEFGSTVSTGTGRQSRYNAALGVVNNNVAGRRPAGAAAWCMCDYWNTTDDQYGIADMNGNLRSDVLPIFQTFPT